MQPVRRLPAAFLLLAAIMVSSFVVEPAEAQVALVPTNLQVTLVDPGLPIVATRPTSLALIVRYETGPGGLQQGPTEVLLAVEDQPEWLSSVPYPLRLEFSQDPQRVVNGSSQVVQASLNVSLREGARAFERGEVSVRAIARPNGNLQGTEAVSPPVAVTVAYNGAVAAEVQGVPQRRGETPGPLEVKGGIPTKVPLLVTNTGNGASTMEFTVPMRPELSQVEPPEPVELGVGESRVVHATLRMPWTTGEEGLLEIQVTPTAQEEVGQVVRASVTVVGRSVATPGVGGVPLVFALVGLALLLRAGRRA